VGRLCTRGKYLGIKRDAHELPYGILTFLLEESKSAGLIKEENRGEGEFRASDKITFLTFFTGRDFNLTILFSLSSRIF
jgi:hypothetical protein